MTHPDNHEFGATLAAQEPFLRRLSRSLIANAMDADEAVQETLLTAWASRDRPASRRLGAETLQALDPERVRAWLSTVLRREVSSSRRGRRPVSTLDDEPVDPQNSLSAEAITQRMERQQVLNEALMEIQVTFRDAIVLRFQDGLTMAEIGELRGLPVNTVKSRVYRGLKEIKGILERRAGDEDREDGVIPWLSAVLPLAFPSGPPVNVTAALGSLAKGAVTPAAVSTAPSLFTSLVAMSFLHKFAVAAAVLVALGALRGLLSQDPLVGGGLVPEPAGSEVTMVEPDPIPTMEPPAESSRLGIALQPDAPGPGAAESPVPAEPALAPGPEIAGRILFMDGSPIPGAEVFALDQGAEKPTELGRTTANPDGTFTLTFGDQPIPATVALKVDMGFFKPKKPHLEGVHQNEKGVELRLDALMIRFVEPTSQSYRRALDTVENKTAFLTMHSVDEDTQESEWGASSYDPTSEDTAVRLLPAGPAYVFHATLGSFHSDDHVAFLEAGRRSGIHQLRLLPDHPLLGSVTATLSGTPLSSGDDASIVVTLLPKSSGMVGRIKLEHGTPQVRRSGVSPGTYRLKVKSDGLPPRGWAIPSLVQEEISVRAGEDTQIEVPMQPAGMARLTISAPELAPGEEVPEESTDPMGGFMVLVRPAGTKRWSSPGYVILDETGKDAVLPFFPVGRQGVIDRLFPAGTIEFKVTSRHRASEVLVAEIIEGQYTDVTIPFPAPK